MPTDKQIIQELLSFAGIAINGDKPWDITVYNEKLYARLLRDTDLGPGESYVEKWWDCPKLDQLFYRVLKSDLDKRIQVDSKFWQNNIRQFSFDTLARLFNFQTPKKSLIVGNTHYSIGNDLFKFMLDDQMNYTSALWHGALNLNEAQTNKLKFICQKLRLTKGLRVLDIGCGWGSFAKYAAENYDVSIVGITISQEQVKYAKAICQGLPVEIRFQDYRELSQEKKPYDRVVSLGMFEHVGYKNYLKYMQIVSQCLKEDGLFLLETIGANSQRKIVNRWIDKYIFPHGQIPTLAQIAKAIEDIFILEDWENLGKDYDKTLMAWYQNINQHWQELSPKYNETFQRMWNYYLLSCAGSFRARSNQLWQMLFTKHGL